MALKDQEVEDEAEAAEQEERKPPTRTDAVEHVRGTIDAWEKWKKKEAAAANAGKRSSEALKAAQERFDKVMEEGLPVNAPLADVRRKLNKVCKAYEELKDAKLGGAEKRKAAKDARAEAREKFEEMMDESKQLSLLL